MTLGSRLTVCLVDSRLLLYRNEKCMPGQASSGTAVSFRLAAGEGAGGGQTGVDVDYTKSHTARGNM